MYELLRQCKEAGFPQTGENNWWWYEDGTRDVFNYERIQLKSDVYEPSLEEAIEACGEDFEGVRRIIDKYSGEFIYWLAECTSKTGICCHGDTALEAVLRLWLELNKK